MCVVVALMAVAAVASVAANVQNNKNVRKQAKHINAQNRLQAEQIADAASVEMNERARTVRRARASARAATSDAGVNLDTGSFLGQLQTFNAQFDQEAGLVMANHKNQQDARQQNAESAMSRLSYKTGLGIITDAAMAAGSVYLGAGAPALAGAATAGSTMGAATAAGTASYNTYPGSARA